MPVYDMKCPRCGKQSTEYDENKWQCLHCSNKFVYKEESPTYQSQTTVNIQGTQLVDLEPYDSANERPYEEPYLKRHSLEEDPKRKELKRRYAIWDEWNQALFPIFLLASASIIFFALQTFQTVWGKVLTLSAPSLPLVLKLITWRKMGKIKAKWEQRRRSLNSRKEIVGWWALCPSCKKKKSSFCYDEKKPASGPVHCECGKQFMLREGKSHAIKR